MFNPFDLSKNIPDWAKKAIAQKLLAFFDGKIPNAQVQELIREFRDDGFFLNSVEVAVVRFVQEYHDQNLVAAIFSQESITLWNQAEVQELLPKLVFLPAEHRLRQLLQLRQLFLQYLPQFRIEVIEEAVLYFVNVLEQEVLVALSEKAMTNPHLLSLYQVQLAKIQGDYQWLQLQQNSRNSQNTNQLLLDIKNLLQTQGQLLAQSSTVRPPAQITGNKVSVPYQLPTNTSANANSVSSLPVSKSDSANNNAGSTSKTSAPAAPVANKRYGNAPFQVAVPLKNVAHFFGRETDRNWILERIASGGSLSLVGERRIGKTWLLQYIQLAAKAELGERYLVAYLDMMNASCETPRGFCEVALQGWGFDTTSFSYNTTSLDEAVKQLGGKGKVGILLLDEFDRLQSRESYNAEFFENLRAIAGSAYLVILTAGRHSLVNVLQKKLPQGSGSPFFNIFMHRDIGLLEAGEALRFMEERGKPLGFPQPTCEGLAELAGPHPLRLQLAGELWWQRKSSKAEPTTEEWEQFIKQYNVACEGFFGSQDKKI